MVRNYNQHKWEIFELRSGSNSKKEMQVETNVHFCKLSDLATMFPSYLHMIGNFVSLTINIITQLWVWWSSIDPRNFTYKPGPLIFW